MEPQAQTEGGILSRNPSEIKKRKRGRPKKDRTQLIPLAAGLSGEERRTIGLMTFNMQPEMFDEMMGLLAHKKVSLTILNCVARFPKESQRQMLESFTRMGARKSKRWLECYNKPPTVEAIATSILKFVVREFPCIGASDAAEACGITAAVFQRQQESSPDG